MPQPRRDKVFSAAWDFRAAFLSPLRVSAAPVSNRIRVTHSAVSTNPNHCSAFSHRCSRISVRDLYTAAQTVNRVKKQNYIYPKKGRKIFLSLCEITLAKKNDLCYHVASDIKYVVSDMIFYCKRHEPLFTANKKGGRCFEHSEAFGSAFQDDRQYC